MRAIAANDNVTMPAWFNILGFAKDANEKNNVDEAGMLESVEMGNENSQAAKKKKKENNILKRVCK